MRCSPCERAADGSPRCLQRIRMRAVVTFKASIPDTRALPMKVAVMGAGAVGCYYGGMLARAGHEVVLIGRPQHVEAIGRNGLHLEAQSFDEHIPLTASTQ